MVSRDQALKVFDNAIEYLTKTRDVVHSIPFGLVVQQIINDSHRRIWTSGIGKAGMAAHKLAATLSSNSIPAAFIHAGEALHGDFGAVREGDLLIGFSNSGKTNEVIQISKKAKENNAFVVLITGDQDNELAKMVDLFICYGHIPEACLLGLTPTTSTMVMLAIADAIAMAAQEARQISYAEYYRNHHAGYLGQLAKQKGEGHVVI